MLFTLRQDGNKLTGSMEGAGGGFFGGSDAGIPITEGKVDGKNVYFKAGNNTYSGRLEGDQIELQRTVELGSALARAEEPTGSRPQLDRRRMDLIHRGVRTCAFPPAFR
jgi:beta-galactosidase